MKINNPYEKIYQDNRIPITPSTTIQEAQQMSRQLSMLYNTFGMALKDLIGLLSFLYHSKQQSNSQPNIVDRENSSNSSVKHSLSQRVYGPSKSGKYSKVEIIKEEKNEGIDFQKYCHKLNSEISKPSKIKSAIQNSGNIERVEVPRGRKQRETLNGYSCLECKDFYKALGEQFSDSNGTNRLCDGCSRHRSNLPPTNYFTNFSQEFGFED